MKKERVLFPCKCDPIHVGHLMQIKYLLNAGYDVTVDIFSTSDRAMSIGEAMFILETIFNGKVYITLHTVSYVEAFPETIVTYYDYIATGNEKIQRIVKDKIACLSLRRYAGYRASKMKEIYKNE